MPLFRRREPESDAPRGVGSDRWLVAGLGNPGARYAGNRHNIGAVVVEEMVATRGAKLKSHKSGCLVAEAVESGTRLVFARPTSYMNESGRPVSQLLRFYKEEPSKLIVVHDELDIPFGDIRIKFGGGTAGNNGLKSVAQHLGTKDFVRVRFGISRPPGRQDAADYVLTDFSKGERDRLPELISEAQDAVERIVTVGMERAMNEINTRT